MNTHQHEGRKNVDPVQFFGMMIPYLPSLLFRLTILLIRLKSNAKKAGKIFQQELIKQGIDKDTAAELTGVYLESSHIRKYIQGFS